MFDGNVLMITGGTGSFGNTVLNRFLNTGVREIRIFSRDEKKQEDMRIALANPKLKFYIGDVRDHDSVCQAMKGVDYVFHAAALKQVPSCEFFPLQATATNVHGSDNVIRAAHECGVKSVVCLSTDKAVYPVNAMGLSKAMMERVASAFARNHPESHTTVSVTRYGNVMYSRGSVIPLFVEQVRSGKPMTITNPNMTRFLMSLDESVALVQYAFENAAPGDLFIRKAPASTIVDLAKAVAMVMGVEPQIQVIGTRHGEKMYESLLSREEMAEAEDRGDYYRVPLDARSLDYGMYVEEGGHDVEREHDYTSHNTQRLSVEEVAALLSDLPEMREALA